MWAALLECSASLGATFCCCGQGPAQGSHAPFFATAVVFGTLGVQEFRVSIRLTGALESDCFLLMVLLGFLKVQDFGAGRGLGLRATYTYVLFKTCTWIGIYICGELRRLLPFGVNLHASEMPKLALAGFEHELFCALRHVQD